MRGLRATSLIVFCVLSAPMPASAAEWSPSELAAPGSHTPSVAIGPSGETTLIATNEFVSPPTRPLDDGPIVYATRAAGGHFSEPRTLALGYNSQVVTGGDEWTAAVVTTSMPGLPGFRAYLRPPGGTFGDPQSLGPEMSNGQYWRLVTGADGTMAVVYFDDGLTVRVRRPGASAFGPAQRLDSEHEVSDTPDIVIGDDGHVTVFWGTLDDREMKSPPEFADGTAEPGSFVHGTFPAAHIGGAEEPVVAGSSDGSIAVAITAKGRRRQLFVRRRGEAQFVLWGAIPDDLQPVWGGTFGDDRQHLAVTMDSGGSVVVASGTASGLAAYTYNGSGPPRRAAIGSVTGFRPHALRAIHDADGGAMLAWSEGPLISNWFAIPDRDRLFSARVTPDSDSIVDVRTLADPAVQGSALLAANASGTAVAAWTQFDKSVFGDGTGPCVRTAVLDASNARALTPTGDPCAADAPPDANTSPQAPRGAFTRPPLRLGAKLRPAAGKSLVSLTATCSAACRAYVTGSVRVGSSRRPYRLAALVDRPLKAQRKAVLAPRLRPRDDRALRRILRAGHRRAIVRLRVSAVGSDGARTASVVSGRLAGRHR